MADMTNDMLSWASSPGVGDASGADLVAYAPVAPEVLIDPRTKKVRHRPNKGRKKRTNRSPLAEPPWELLHATGYPIPPDLKNLRTTPVNWRRGPSYNLWKVRVREMWGTTCHLCGHGEAYTADHLVPVSLWSNQPYDARLSRPAHGIDGCPTCYVKCNSSRGNRQLAIDIGNYKPPITL